jgi:GT2 family glycosyltransferase
LRGDIVLASIVIATYNRESVLIDSINSVLSQHYKNFELVVVDQTLHHEKTTQKFLDNLNDKRFRYFHVSPPSIAAAENFGISKARGEIVIFIDDDVIVNDQFIDSHVKAYDNPSVGGVAGRIVEPGQQVSDTLYHLTSYGWAKRGGSLNYVKDSETTDARGCNMSFRKTVLVELGYFDTQFVKNAYRFESDMCYRVVNAGYKILFCANASLIHLHIKNGGSRSVSGLFGDVESYKNSARYFYKMNNKTLMDVVGFYVGLFRTVPNINPLLSLRRLAYLFVGARQAKIELSRLPHQIISKETRVKK